MSRYWGVGSLWMLVVVACGGAPSDPDGGAAEDAAVVRDGAATPTDGATPTTDAAVVRDGATPTTASFVTLGNWLDYAVSSGEIHGYGLMVFSGDDQLLFERASGQCVTRLCSEQDVPYSVDLVTGTASSSKWVASTITLAALEDAIDAGNLPSLEAGLGTTVGRGLDCGAALPPEVADITVAQLLSFTSGLLSTHHCVGDRTADVTECACSILRDSANVRADEPSNPRQFSHAPGTVYSYSDTDLIVAMAMVEAVTGQHWRDYFVARVRDPAGMGDAQFLNPLNPSGSMWASITEYASFVRTLFHDGRDGAAVVLSAEAVALQQANHMPPDVVRVSTPEPDLEYGLNNWRWCYQPVDARVLGDANQIVPDLSCASEHLTGHSGKGGFGPWIDVQRGIYGIRSANRVLEVVDSPCSADAPRVAQAGALVSAR